MGKVRSASINLGKNHSIGAAVGKGRASVTHVKANQDGIKMRTVSAGLGRSFKAKASMGSYATMSHRHVGHVPIAAGAGAGIGLAIDQRRKHGNHGIRNGGIR